MVILTQGTCPLCDIPRDSAKCALEGPMDLSFMRLGPGLGGVRAPSGPSPGLSGLVGATPVCPSSCVLGPDVDLGRCTDSSLINRRRGPHLSHILCPEDVCSRMTTQRTDGLNQRGRGVLKSRE